MAREKRERNRVEGGGEGEERGVLRGSGSWWMAPVPHPSPPRSNLVKRAWHSWRVIICCSLYQVWLSIRPFLPLNHTNTGCINRLKHEPCPGLYCILYDGVNIVSLPGPSQDRKLNTCLPLGLKYELRRLFYQHMPFKCLKLCSLWMSDWVT